MPEETGCGPAIEDNPSPYPVPFADLTAVTFAVDGDYLYVRLTVSGPYPTTEGQLPWYGRDQIRKLNVSIALGTDNNKDTGSPGNGGAEVMLGTGMTTTPDCGWMDVYDFWYGPTGIESPEERRWEHMNNRLLVVAHATFDVLGPGGLGSHVVVRLPD